MPDEEPQGNVAVATPEPVTLVTGTEQEPGAPPEEPESGAQKAEQEPGAPPEEPESGAQDLEPERIRMAILDDIEELAKSDPTAANELRKRLAIEQPDVSEEKFAWELERGRAERQARWNNATATFQQYTPEAQQVNLENYLEQLNEAVQGAAKRLAEGEITDASLVRFDARGVAQALAPMIAAGQQQLQETMAAATQSVLLDALEAHPSHRHLTDEERTQYNQAVMRGGYSEAIKLHLDAAIRAAPEHIAKEAKEQAAKDAALLDKYASLREKLGGNGKKALTGGAAAASGPTTLEEVNNALMDPATPIEQLSVLQKKRDQLLGR